MVSYSMTLTPTEAHLVSDIKDLQYGEILNVELESDGRPSIQTTLTRQQQELVKLIRSGVVSFRRIKVHQADPMYAEATGTTQHGFDCIKLTKFN